MPKFVIKKGDLSAKAESETQSSAAPRFVFHKNDVGAKADPEQHQGGVPKIVFHKNEGPARAAEPEQSQESTPKFVFHKSEQPPTIHAPAHQFHIAKKSAPAGSYPGVASVEGGRYRIDEVIGEGGSGRVCRAYDTLLEMEVAIKFLNPDLVRDEESINALKAETRICLQLVHKHIIRIFNLDKRGANFMIIMEYLKGGNLFSLLSQCPNGMDLEFVSQVVAITTDALAHAHRHGIIHKDITPGNIFITDDGLLKVIDFGISSVVNRQNCQEDTVVGTPVYMSPEQLRGEILDCRTDIYSLGVLIHQMLTGRTVNADDASVQDMAYRPRPIITCLPQKIADVLNTATAFSPADRWESMDRFGAAFAAAVRG